MRALPRSLMLIFVCGLTAACTPAMSPAPRPPLIERVGIPVVQSMTSDTVIYEFADGTRWTADTAVYRLLNGNWGGDLVIAGRDSVGPFIYALMTQGGLPEDCYVENGPGIDRAGHVELRAIAWPKDPEFVQDVPVAPNNAYPAASRFCFNANGLVSRSVAP